MLVPFRTILSSCTFVILAIASSPAAAETIKDYEIAVAKGQYAFEQRDYREAAASFEKALMARPGDRTATLSLGMSLSRGGELARARDVLLRALAADPNDARTRYEVGIVMYGLGEREEAKDFFEAVLAGAAPEQLRSGARKYLGLIGGAAGAGKRLSLDIAAAVQYDSNVVLEPDNAPAGAKDKKDDWRAVAMFDAGYRFLRTGATTADAGYLLYQNVHKELEDFNVQQHNGKLAANHAFSGTLSLGMEYRFSYSTVSADHYSTVHRVAPVLTAAFTPSSRTELHYAYESRRYINSPVFPANAERNGSNNTAGVTHIVRLPQDREFAVGYEYDKDSAEVKYWSATGHRGILKYRTMAFGAYRVSADASYCGRKYDAVQPGYAAIRKDGVQEYSLSVSRNVSDSMSVVLSDTHTIHDSNLPAYEYSRNIAGLFLVVRL